MIPVREDSRQGPFPYVTITIIALLAIIYLWDRDWHLWGPRFVFADMAARPTDIVAALSGTQREPLLTLFTSIFLHADLQHILSNVLFLWVFGPSVEQHFGLLHFAFYYLFFGMFAALTQVFVIPASGAAMLGASGAIAGVMGAYLLLFPASRIEGFIPPFFWWVFAVPAWALLTFWFLFQILVVQPGVANWAHAGGFLAGVLLVLMTKANSRRNMLEVQT